MGGTLTHQKGAPRPTKGAAIRNTINSPLTPEGGSHPDEG